MNSHDFPECNCVFKAPPDLAELQCMAVKAYRGKVSGGSVDGSPFVVVAWMPTKEELEMLNNGSPLFISFIGGMPPHFPSVTFHEATHPQ